MKDSADKELQDFLNGSDSVSATYQSLQDEKPSAALDQSILQAARESVADNVAQQPRIPKQAYSIAASVCVAVLVISLFVNNEAELTRSEIDSFSIPLSDTPTVEMMSADDALADMQINTNAVAETIEINANRVVLPAPQIEADSLEAAGAATLSSLAEEAVQEAEAFEARAMEEVTVAAQRSEVQEQSRLYRQNVDSWLLEILRLSEADNQAALLEERELFAEAYPDINIDSALAEL